MCASQVCRSVSAHIKAVERLLLVAPVACIGVYVCMCMCMCMCMCVCVCVYAAGQSFGVTVGAGGVGGSCSAVSYPSNGGNSIFGSYTALGIHSVSASSGLFPSFTFVLSSNSLCSMRVGFHVLLLCNAMQCNAIQFDAASFSGGGYGGGEQNICGPAP